MQNSRSLVPTKRCAPPPTADAESLQQQQDGAAGRSLRWAVGSSGCVGAVARVRRFRPEKFLFLRVRACSLLLGAERVNVGSAWCSNAHSTWGASQHGAFPCRVDAAGDPPDEDSTMLHAVGQDGKAHMVLPPRRPDGSTPPLSRGRARPHPERGWRWARTPERRHQKSCECRVRVRSILKSIFLNIYTIPVSCAWSCAGS